MKAGGGHAKGAQFEREVCKKLSLWISDNIREDIFWRSAMSGGRATRMKQSGKQAASIAGDIVSTDSIGEKLLSLFMVECKFYQDLKIMGMAFDLGSALSGFWNVATEEAKSYKKLPMLIAKQNRLPPMVFLTPAGANYLYVSPHVFVAFPKRDCVGILFDDFLDNALSPWVPPAKPKLQLKSRK